MQTSKPKIIGVGDPIVDLLVQVSEEELATLNFNRGVATLIDTETREKVLTQLFEKPIMRPGGAASNTIFALARLGLPVAMSGKVGLDMYGQFFCQEFCKNGGVLDKFLFTDTLPTSCCLSLITPDFDRTMLPNLAASTDITLAERGEHLFEGFDLAYFEGYNMRSCEFENMLAQAKNSGAKVCLDLGDKILVEELKDSLPAILDKYVDIVFANADEAVAFCGDIPVMEQIKELGKRCEVAVIKLGKNGCIVKDADDLILESDGVVVEAVDTTAAGDLFHAGFLYGYLNKQSTELSAFFGNTLGSEVVKVIGSVIPPERWSALQFKLQLF